MDTVWRLFERINQEIPKESAPIVNILTRMGLIFFCFDWGYSLTRNKVYYSIDLGVYERGISREEIITDINQSTVGWYDLFF